MVLQKTLPSYFCLFNFQVAKLFSFTWTLGVVACKLLSYLQTVSGICSVINLTALSFERSVKTCLKMRKLLSLALMIV